MANGITDETPPPGGGFTPYNVDPKSQGFRGMGESDYKEAETGYLESTLPFMKQRETRAGKRLAARNAAMGITDDPASQKLYSETIEEPYAREESAIRGEAKGKSLGMKERDIDRWNQIVGNLTGRGFQREERIGSQEYATGERVGSQEYATGAREASQTWQASERVAGQEHDITMAESAQGWQAEQNELSREHQVFLAEMEFEEDDGGGGIGGGMLSNIGEGTTTENIIRNLGTGGVYGAIGGITGGATDLPTSNLPGLGGGGDGWFS